MIWIYNRAVFALFICTLALFATLSASAQRIEYGGGLGGLVYKGDLSTYYNPAMLRPMGELLFRYNPSYATSFRANIAIGSIIGNGAESNNLYISQIQPNAFQSTMFELAGLLEYNFLDFRNPKYEHLRGTPFLVGGVSLLVYKPGDVEAKTSSNIIFGLPIGFGYKYRLTKNLNVGAEFISRFTFSDLLDDVSTVDVPRNLQRGYRNDNDWYAQLALTVTYTIYTVQCPFDYN